jgi:two-component system sensor histidine kinase BaeS
VKRLARRPGLGVQLGVAFAAVAALTTVLSAAIQSISWQRVFDSYVAERVQSDAQAIADLTARAYALDRGWSYTSLAGLAVWSARKSLRVQVLDAAGDVLIDSADFGPTGTMPGMPGFGATQELEQGQSSTSPMREPVVQVPVYVDDEPVGAVRVASASPGSFLTQQDVDFRSASSGGLLAAALLALVLATAGGIAYSRLFTRPIERVTRTAAALRSGEMGARTGMRGEDPVGVLGRTLDGMADSIEAEREFERRLTADVAHELRTPLQAIQATVEAMQDGVLPSDTERLGIVRDETVRLARLTDSILELSRLETRTAALRTDRIDLSEPLTQAIEAHRALLESLELSIDSRVAEGTAVIGDPDRLTQAFGNLLANAAQYTPAGGTVSVTLRMDQGEAVVDVADSGIGLTAEDGERAFSRFWRADAARDRARGGFGIGLAVVREIVGRHGGTVTLGPNPTGQGALATVRLPLA